MIEIIKPVRYGLLIGLLGLTFGIGWAFWLVLGHERIHKNLEERAAEKKEMHSLIQLLEPGSAMGLGLVTIAISFILAFTSAPEKIKTVASILTGLGGLIYPFAWIVMGYRTPNLGPGGAEASVTVIAGPGVALVALGIFTAGVFLLKDTFSKKQ